MLNTKQIRAMRRNGEFAHRDALILPYKHVVMAVLAFILLIMTVGVACASNSPKIEGYTLDQWANAIRKSEGNSNYGILSVPCSTTQECRRICKNTVRNNHKRWIKAGKRGDYLTFLANRYCPIGASNDPKGLNKHWKKNVAYHLTKGK